MSDYCENTRTTRAPHDPSRSCARSQDPSTVHRTKVTILFIQNSPAISTCSRYQVALESKYYKIVSCEFGIFQGRDPSLHILCWLPLAPQRATGISVTLPVPVLALALSCIPTLAVLTQSLNRNSHSRQPQTLRLNPIPSCYQPIACRAPQTLYRNLNRNPDRNRNRNPNRNRNLAVTPAGHQGAAGKRRSGRCSRKCGRRQRKRQRQTSTH